MIVYIGVGLKERNRRLRGWTLREARRRYQKYTQVSINEAMLHETRRLLLRAVLVTCYLGTPLLVVSL